MTLTHNEQLLPILDEWYATHDDNLLWYKVYPIIKQVAKSYIYSYNRKNHLSQAKDTIESDADDITLKCIEDLKSLTSRDEGYRIEIPSAWIHFRYLKVRFNKQRQFEEKALSLNQLEDEAEW